MLDFKERLQHLMRRKNISQSGIVRGAGFDKAQVSNWLSGTVKNPRDTTIHKLAYFFECNIDWLATGTGEPFPSTTKETIIERSTYGYPTDKTKPSAIGIKGKSSRIAELYKIPVLGNVPAGIPNTLEEYVEEYISVPNAPPDCYALKVDGESMEPGIRHGDYVLFVINRDPRSGDIVVVNDEFGDSMIKRYKVKGDEQRLVSDNPAYPAYTPNDHYRIMGVVVGGWRELKI